MDSPGHRNLVAWRRARALAISVYRATASPELKKEWALRDQMRRAALSAPSNIAEGYTRDSERDCARFFAIARGSLAELSTQADIAASVQLLERDVADGWERECDELRSILTRLIKVKMHASTKRDQR